VGDENVGEHGDDVPERQVSPETFFAISPAEICKNEGGSGQDSNCESECCGIGVHGNLLSVTGPPRWEPHCFFRIVQGDGDRKQPLQLFERHCYKPSTRTPKLNLRNPTLQCYSACAIYNWQMDSAAPPVLRRILALDVGAKRIGVAISDPLGITAQGLETIQRQNKRRDLEALGQVLTKYDVREIVVGLPLRLSGAEGTQSEKMRRFADDLRAHFGLTVHLWDERWTSTEANRLLRETDLSIKKRGQAVDRMAATLILQSWMVAHPLR